MGMSETSSKRRIVLSLFVLALGVTGGIAGAPSARADTCPDVDVSFARGTLDPGILGGPFFDAVEKYLPGQTVGRYDVDYAADILQTSAGEGATDMTEHVTSVAESCPNTAFVLGGYSQGATVTDIAIGIDTILGKGEIIPMSLAPRVAAVVVYGNPLALTAGSIIKDSPIYGPKTKEFCNTGDPVCANGANVLAHLLYPLDGSAEAGGKFVAQQVFAQQTGEPVSPPAGPPAPEQPPS